MRKIAVCILLVSAVAFAQELPVPGVSAARDVPNAKETPIANNTYKVVFDIGRGAAKPEEVNPMLEAMGRYINTLAKFGVPADKRKIAAVFHQGGTSAILRDDEYKARNNGKSNPNIAMIQALSKAGVDFRVCGQAVLANKIDQKTILPEIQVDLWALTTLVTLQSQGYVKVGQ